MLRFDHVTLHALRVEMTDGRQLLAVAPGRRFRLARARHRAASGGMLGGPRMNSAAIGVLAGLLLLLDGEWIVWATILPSSIR
jgi:hypothetical protein